ncbi:MAG: hypothetical protein H7Y31_12165 [Chitinophagaceae bacterium]|nr:hypothetical protein [Chitinophagaceae bacterium]
MKKTLFVFTILLLNTAMLSSQELYVFTEPASNMPARSISGKYNFKMLRGLHSDRIEQRHNADIMFGLNKKWMLHAGTSFSDMYSNNVQWESMRLYAKYRFFSVDDVHSHFRMAAFFMGSYSKNTPYYDELALDGDQSGVQVGVIATQLLHKLAFSASLSNVQILQSSRWEKVWPQSNAYQAVDYTLSAGYLLFPRTYQSFKQVNVNLYVELLGQRTYDLKRYYTDLAPAIQLIFNSNAKLNLGYRFQLGSDMHRMGDRSFLLGFEWTWLNAY